MDAPVCKICGQKHWSRMCEPVTKSVTPRDTVTATVTPLREADLEIECRALRADVERLTAEVAHLKRELAAARTDEPQTVGATASARRPMTAAERQRKRRKAKQVV